MQYTYDTQTHEDPWDDYEMEPPEDTDPGIYPAKRSPPDNTTAYDAVLQRAVAFHKMEMH